MQLIDKEAVLEILKPMIQIAETIEDEGLRKFVLGGFTNAHNKISSLPVYGEWISVKERLPDKSDPVWVIYNTRPEDMSYNIYYPDTNRWRWEVYDDDKEWVTYWMYAPEFPPPPNQ